MLSKNNKKHWFHDFQTTFLQAFLEACYHPENLPLRSPPDFVANVGTIVRQVKVRGSSKDLKGVATPQQQPCAASNTQFPPMDGMMGFGMGHWMDMMMEQAKTLDTLQKKLSNDDRLTSRCCSQSLVADDRSQQYASLLSSKALPSEDTVLPLPAPATIEEPEANQSTDLTNKEIPPKSLEDYEIEAKNQLAKRKANQLDTVLKRPASKKSTPKVAAKDKDNNQGKKDKRKHVTPSFLKGIYGCVRCRGNVKGCDSCRSPYFAGQRFSSRDEYNKWYQKK